MKRKTLPRRRGSALVMVLGMLAILMLMAIAFGTFVRTERSGATNLKNGAVARNSLYTAVGRVMEAIDASFDSPDDDWPVAVWPNPWLASSSFTDDDHILSARRGSLDPHLDVPGLTPAERNNLAKVEDKKAARILTDEISKYLSPAQLALVRNAKCKWAPLKGAITATKRQTDRQGGVTGNVGRPEGDDLIGRYAFVVLETTGLPDMNVLGCDDQGPSHRDPADPSTFVLPADSAAGEVVDEVHKAANQRPWAFKSYVKNLDDFDDNRLFASLADARENCADSTFDNGPFAKNDILPADFFSGFSPSLQELNPAGRPKIFFPSQKEFDGYEAPAVKNFYGRVFAAMVAVFARSREANDGWSPTDYGKDLMKVFQGTTREYELNRSALAAVSIMDGVDGDNIPGQCDSGKANVNYWAAFDGDVKAPHKVRGSTPKENVLANVKKADVRENKLNFPCTESAFLLESVCAWITWDEPSAADLSQADEGATLDYTGHLHVRARAMCANTTDESHSHKGKMMLEWFVLPGEPKTGTSSKEEGTEIQDDHLEWDENGDKMIDWGDLFPENSFQPIGGKSQWETVSTEDKNRKDADLSLVADDELEFTVTVQAVPGPDEDGDGEPDDWKFLPPTRAQYDLDDSYADYGPDGAHPSGSSHPQDVFIPVAVKVSIKDEFGGVETDVQQVPAPALEKDSSNGWWVRVNPCVYHGPDSNFDGAGDPWGDPEQGDGNAGGWALCLAPPFAFDTTSLRDPNGQNELNFWISDLVSRSSGGGGNNWGGAGQDAGDEDLENLLWSGNKAGQSFMENFIDGNASWDGSGATTLRETWLFNYGTYQDKPFRDWLNFEASQNKFMPDFLHKAGKSRDVFHKDQSETLSLSEIYTRIPAKGWKHPADLGGAMCGPYETLSLFKTWRKTGGVDFHPVLDYFASEPDRYPSTNDISRYVRNDIGSGDFGFDRERGDMKWGGRLSAAGNDLFSAAHNGRVNLNLPRLVKVVSSSGRGERSSPARYNPFPVATVFNGANVFSKANKTSMLPRWIGEKEAFALAFDVCRMLENADTDDDAVQHGTCGESLRFSSASNSVRRPFVRNVSFLGQGSGNDNQLLHDFLIYQKEGTGTDRYPQNDADREGLLRATVDGFCTRGQTFLAIIRADAYSPKFGENESAEDGATLATTHALVELFRDPVPARAADGSLPVDGDGRPIIYHNWYIRSFRVF